MNVAAVSAAVGLTNKATEAMTKVISEMGTDSPPEEEDDTGTVTNLL